MALRVCIPTAGTGSRLGESTRYLNKSLVGVAGKPILSHIIDQFPEDTEFVLALGHKGHLVREFLALAYPRRALIFVDVFPFEGPGSGLGFSLMQCREHLQVPFVFVSCDTLVRNPIPSPDENWMGFSALANSGEYRSIAIEDGCVSAICEKGEAGPGERRPYIGLAGVRDFEVFWAAMESGGEVALATGEVFGLSALVGKGMRAECFEWFDTGNREALIRARDAYRNADEPTVLEKVDEAIWFMGEEVIKFSDDPQFISNRVIRAKGLGTIVPEVTGKTDHMYSYKTAPGRVLSEVATKPLFARLLNECEVFWEPCDLSGAQRTDFEAGCRRFYLEKTLQRVALFYRNFGRSDGTETINDIPMPTLSDLLDRVDWDKLSQGMPGRFHGDFHFENILWSQTDERFTFLDWRQDFAGSLAVGDIYYDLAKLLHGLIVNHEIIHSGHFNVRWELNLISLDFQRKQRLVECEMMFMSWLDEHGYDGTKVRILTALIFLNIAALHHYPYCLLLYGLGKSLLADTLACDTALATDTWSSGTNVKS